MMLFGTAMLSTASRTSYRADSPTLLIGRRDGDWQMTGCSRIRGLSTDGLANRPSRGMPSRMTRHSPNASSAAACLDRHSVCFMLMPNSCPASSRLFAGVALEMGLEKHGDEIDIPVSRAICYLAKGAGVQIGNEIKKRVVSILIGHGFLQDFTHDHYSMLFQLNCRNYRTTRHESGGDMGEG